jgi:hypothetical protein
MSQREVAWSSLAVAVLAPVAYWVAIRTGLWFVAGDSDRSKQIVRLMWLAFLASEAVAVILSIVACSGRRNAPKAAPPPPAILAAIVALLGLAYFGLLFRPGA